jgi:hypothetical protein
MKKPLIYLAGLLLLSSCATSSANAISFPKAIASAKELNKYQFEISLVVDKEIAMSSTCDVEISSLKMRCTAELDGESGEYLSDLSTGTIYYALDTPLSSDRDPSIPENIKWVKVESDLAVPQFSSPVASNPLAILDSIEELSPTEVSDLSRNGETYKGFKVNIPKNANSSELPLSNQESPDSGLYVILYIDASSNLRGIVYSLGPDISEGTVEIWINDASFESISMPDPETVISYDDLEGFSFK